MRKVDFSSLRWWRLTAKILNIRAVPSRSEQPVSVFQAIVKGVCINATGAEDPLVFFHLRDRSHTFRMREGDRVILEVFFCRHDRAFVERWRETLAEYLADSHTGKNFEILDLGTLEERTWGQIAAEIGPLPTEGELCLELLTPLPFRPESKKPRT